MSKDPTSQILKKIFLVLLFTAATMLVVLSLQDAHQEEFALTILFLFALLVIARLSSLVERFGQPAVLGELTAGIIVGNLAITGITFFEPLRHNEIVSFLAELGVVILLFQIGLESNIKEMSKVGMRAAAVAVLGVVLPFVLGTFVVGPFLLPNLSFAAYLFIGAALTATSVGITARVFRDLGTLNSSESKIVLGAAVIDDVLGLIILSVISAIATVGTVSLGSIGFIVLKAAVFLTAAVFLGQATAPMVSRAFASINTGIGMKFTLALSFGLLFAYLAHLVGLAPIVGAFAAGLILDPVHFKYFKDSAFAIELREAILGLAPGARKKVAAVMNHHSHRHIEDLIEPIGLFFVPVFFIMTGFSVDLRTLLNPATVGVALAITAVAIIGKVLAGLAAGNVRKWVVGWGMVPRGEVGLIFATIGRGLGVISENLFSIIVIMVILTSLVTPLVLGWLLKRKAAHAVPAKAKKAHGIHSV